MKKLLLIRHAKAGSHDLTDFNRPLTDSGIHDAEFMAHQLQKAGLLPQYILTSAALRTQTTANIIAGTLNITHTAADQAIYEAGTRTLFGIINHLPAEYDFIALVGHNPGISQVLYELSGETRDMPPAGIALIEFDINEWELVHTDTGKLSWYDSPREH
mgnify:CR=1 FL=1